MRFTEDELKILYFLSHDFDTISDMARDKGIPQDRIDAVVAELKRKEILDRSFEGIQVAPNPFAVRLMHTMSLGIGRARYLCGMSLEVMSELREERTMEEVATALGIPEDEARRIATKLGETGAVMWKGLKYRINEKLWNGLRKLLDSMEDFEEMFDPRVPRGVEIYSSTDEAVVYATVKGGPGQFTAFSAFQEYYGDQSFYSDEYMTTYDGPMTLDRAFDDAYLACQATNDYRLRTSLLMMYLKHREAIHPREEFMDTYRRLEAGEDLFMWPCLKEVEAKVEEGL